MSRERELYSLQRNQNKSNATSCFMQPYFQHLFRGNWPDEHKTSLWSCRLSQQDSGQLMQAELHFQQQLLSNANSQSHLVFVYPCIHYWHRTGWAQDHNCIQPLVPWTVSGRVVLFSRVALSCHNAVLFCYVLIWAFLLSIFTWAITKYGGVA